MCGDRFWEVYVIPRVRREGKANAGSPRITSRVEASLAFFELGRISNTYFAKKVKASLSDLHVAIIEAVRSGIAEKKVKIKCQSGNGKHAHKCKHQIRLFM
jgi:hypothetical protein